MASCNAPSMIATLAIALWLHFGGFAFGGSPAPKFTVESPREYQVFQRGSRAAGAVEIRLRGADASGKFEFRIQGKPHEGEIDAAWRPLKATSRAGAYAAQPRIPAGGWYRLELRELSEGKLVAEAHVEHFGVGEVFVVAGQSNSTNYGSEKQRSASGLVSTFDGQQWRIADDPQPGVQDGSGGGSFLPAFGDALVKRFGVPIGVASTGAGATSVRQWLPRGEKMTEPPTIAAYVKPAGPGQWESTGQLYDGLIRRIDALGPHGFRAILWHQGESDAGQARAGYGADKQITGEQYRAFLEKLILATRRHAGWDIPWFVARATYHSEQDAADEEFRSAQLAICHMPGVHPGPDTDALRSEYRTGVHFNGKGLQAHGRAWADQVGPWLDSLLK